MSPWEASKGSSWSAEDHGALRIPTHPSACPPAALLQGATRSTSLAGTVAVPLSSSIQIRWMGRPAGVGVWGRAMDLACLHCTLLPAPPPHPPFAPSPSAPQLTSEEGAAGSLRLSLNLPLRGIRTSLLSLAVAADNVTFVVNRSPARIDAVEVGWLAAPACRPACCRPAPPATGPPSSRAPAHPLSLA